MPDEHETRRYNDRYGTPPSCLACQESYARDAGEIRQALRRLEEQGEKMQETLARLPVLDAEHAALRRTVEAQDAIVLQLRLDQAKGKGMLVVIGVIVGIIGSFLSNFLMHRFGGN